ncbi:GrpB family protein [Ureibacillus acetophenoni]|uniref:GrpB-like predicted nucleotidyltransferase (UPF0157 family) n=1 Tax=Ureibacillus acetophenoni TaxID=614649 RepID=A0A285ULI6_9BACL|nr:GrpB family protein [Ureibacillus acetophenoni]SOC42740.1 GrpB-like predicted nucleotidyltransferase (UPF0157 family) [Ureibacillus acetophenoni]
MRKTEIRRWTERWTKQYEEQEIVLKQIFKKELYAIYHIGSTSIPSIGYAKPIIDILIVVKDINRIDFYNDAMISKGYNPRGENGIAGRRYFTKGNENRTHHVHIFQEGNEDINIHLAFKEYLLHHLEDAKKYGELKLKLASKFPDDTHQYQNGKAEFTSQLVKKALIFSSKTEKE